MNEQTLLILGGIIGLIFAFGKFITNTTTPKVEENSESKFVFDGQTKSFEEIWKFWGDAYNVDPKLLEAISLVESNFDQTAVNPSDPSYGLMQILCVTEPGSNKCTNKFNINNWDKATTDKLLNPDFNVEMAAQILGWNLQTYGFPQGVAVYNSWNARKDPANGPFRNQGYVDKVLRNYSGNGF